MAKKDKKKPAVVARLRVISEGDGFEFDVSSELSPEIMAELLRLAADNIEGKTSRASGAWGA